MKIFVVRHGNTFGDDQAGGKRIFMSGSQNNIPLVNTGREQARQMAAYLDQQNIVPNAIYANHLIRTWEHATIIREYFYHKHQTIIPLMLDENLMEIDYGSWSGLTSDGETAETNEVIAKFGSTAWDQWQKERIILNEPPHNWQPTREQLIANLKNFFDRLRQNHEQDETIIALGSQGSITFLNALFEGGMEQAIAEDRYKIKTGRFVEIDFDGQTLNCIRWNEKPI